MILLTNLAAVQADLDAGAIAVIDENRHPPKLSGCEHPQEPTSS